MSTPLPPNGAAVIIGAGVAGTAAAAALCAARPDARVTLVARDATVRVRGREREREEEEEGGGCWTRFVRFF